MLQIIITPLFKYCFLHTHTPSLTTFLLVFDEMKEYVLSYWNI